MLRHAEGYSCEARGRRRSSFRARAPFSGAPTMRAIIAISAAPRPALTACSPDNDVTGSIESCASKLYSSYNPKDMKQCVGVCIACNRGVTTTCCHLPARSRALAEGRYRSLIGGADFSAGAGGKRAGRPTFARLRRAAQAREGSRSAARRQSRLRRRGGLVLAPGVDCDGAVACAICGLLAPS